MVAKRANWQVHRKHILWHLLELSLRNLRRSKDSFAFYLIENEIYTTSLTSQNLQNLTHTALTALSASHTTFFVPRTFHSHWPFLHFLNTLSLFIPCGLKLSIYVPGMLFWLSSWHLCLISNVTSTERPKLDTLFKLSPSYSLTLKLISVIFPGFVLLHKSFLNVPAYYLLPSPQLQA